MAVLAVLAIFTGITVMAVLGVWTELAVLTLLAVTAVMTLLAVLAVLVVLAVFDVLAVMAVLAVSSVKKITMTCKPIIKWKKYFTVLNVGVFCVYLFLFSLVILYGVVSEEHQSITNKIKHSGFCRSAPGFDRV